MAALATWTGVLHVTAAAVLTLAGEIHRGVNAVQRLGKLLRDHRLVGRGADGTAIRGGRARRRGALARAGGGRLWHAHRRALLRGVAHVGDPERTVARGLARRALPRRRGCGGKRVHGGRPPAGAPADAPPAGAGRMGGAPPPSPPPALPPAGVRARPPPGASPPPPLAWC